MKALIKGVNFGVSLLLILAAIAIAYIAVPAFGNKALIVRSGSMQPTIKVGDLVVVKTQRALLTPQSIIGAGPLSSAKISLYKEGNIIAFKSQNDSKLFTTHRIVGKEVKDGKVFYQTKGDANNAADQNLVAEENVIGKTTIKLPYFGRLFAFAKGNIGFPLLVIFPALLVIILEMISIYKEIKRQNRLVQVPAPKENFAGLKVIIPIFMSVMVMHNAFAYFSDTETSIGNIFQAAASFCSPGTVFQIGDIEATQMDIPTDEFNWLGITFPLPPFTKPFIVGITPTKEFPANSNKAYNYATDFDVQFQMPYSALAKLTISWSPGRSANERKEVLLDGINIGTTPTRLGTSVAGWWEQMQRFEDSFETSITYGQHTFTFLHPIGDGTVWDWVKLEITECPSPSPTPTPTPSPSPSPSPSSEPTPTPTPGPDSVVINEINWAGSNSDSDDEWLELKNTTSSPIDLTDWKLEGAATGSTVITISSSTIPANGFFLISRFDASSSAINVSPDIIESSLQLDNTGLQIILKNASGTEIDRADDDSGTPFAGSNVTPKKSMERISPPGDGTQSANWQTAITHTNMDGSTTSDEFGTPKAENGT